MATEQVLKPALYFKNRRLRMKINSIIDLCNYDIPAEVLTDVYKRITDWMASGGKEDDPYIKQQLRYAERFVRC